MCFFRKRKKRVAVVPPPPAPTPVYNFLSSSKKKETELRAKIMELRSQYISDYNARFYPIVKSYRQITLGLKEESSPEQNAEILKIALAEVNASGLHTTLNIPEGTFKVKSIYIRNKRGVNLCLLGAGIGKTTIVSDGTIGNTKRYIAADRCDNLTLAEFTVDFGGIGKTNGGRQVRLSAAASFGTNINLVHKSIRFTNCGYIAVGMGNNINSVSVDCQYDDIGFDGPTANGGSALWLTTLRSLPHSNNKVMACRFTDNRWHGLHGGGDNFEATYNIFERNEEAHIYVSQVESGGDLTTFSKNHKLSYNIMDDLKMRDITSAPIEIGCDGVEISHNVIRSSDHGLIALTNVKNGKVFSNILSNAGKGAPRHSSIGINTLSRFPRNTESLDIYNNIVYDDQIIPTTGYAAGIFGPVKAKNIRIFDNHFDPDGYVKGEFRKLSGWDDATCEYFNNNFPIKAT